MRPITTLPIPNKVGQLSLVKTLCQTQMVRVMRASTRSMVTLLANLALCLLRMAIFLWMLMKHAFPRWVRLVVFIVVPMKTVVRPIQETTSSHRLRSRDVGSVPAPWGLTVPLAPRTAPEPPQIALLTCVEHAALVPLARLWTERVSACVTMAPLIRGMLLGLNAKSVPMVKSILVLSSITMVMECVTNVLRPIHTTLPLKMLLPPLLRSSCAAKNLDVVPQSQHKTAPVVTMVLPATLFALAMLRGPKC
mmetsp:Transcript_23316/g.37963  ORF Transcript_23316/g.37963 Transcript_23316/m.37963 type:complete len:250 (+) Transcript_23316:1790-2539(+)